MTADKPFNQLGMEPDQAPPAPAPRPRPFPCLGNPPGPRCGHTLTAISGPEGEFSAAKLVLFGKHRVSLRAYFFAFMDCRYIVKKQKVSCVRTLHCTVGHLNSGCSISSKITGRHFPFIVQVEPQLWRARREQMVARLHLLEHRLDQVCKPKHMQLSTCPGRMPATKTFSNHHDRVSL